MVGRDRQPAHRRPRALHRPADHRRARQASRVGVRRRDRVRRLRAVRGSRRDELPTRAARSAETVAATGRRGGLPRLDRHRRARAGTTRLAALRVRAGGGVRRCRSRRSSTPGRSTTCLPGRPITTVRPSLIDGRSPRRRPCRCREAPGITTWHSFSSGAHYDAGQHALRASRSARRARAAAGRRLRPTRPHRGLEIVSWVLAGTLQHEDSTGRRTTVAQGMVQHLSAGSGIEPRRAQRRATTPLRFIQMWLLDDRRGAPAYRVEASDWLGCCGSIERICRSSARAGEPITLPDAPFVHVFVARGSAEVTAVGDSRNRRRRAHHRRATGIGSAGTAELLILRDATRPTRRVITVHRPASARTFARGSSDGERHALVVGNAQHRTGNQQPHPADERQPAECRGAGVAGRPVRRRPL